MSLRLSIFQSIIQCKIEIDIILETSSQAAGQSTSVIQWQDAGPLCCCAIKRQWSWANSTIPFGAVTVSSTVRKLRGAALLDECAD
jgi:hypothetical protein